MYIKSKVLQQLFNNDIIQNLCVDIDTKLPYQTCRLATPLSHDPYWKWDSATNKVLFTCKLTALWESNTKVMTEQQEFENALVVMAQVIVLYQLVLT